jgi:hypothetical protein
MRVSNRQTPQQHDLDSCPCHTPIQSHCKLHVNELSACCCASVLPCSAKERQHVMGEIQMLRQLKREDAGGLGCLTHAVAVL